MMVNRDTTVQSYVLQKSIKQETNMSGFVNSYNLKSKIIQEKGNTSSNYLKYNRRSPPPKFVFKKFCCLQEFILVQVSSEKV